MPVIKLTKSAVDRLHYTDDGITLYWDERLKGFGVRVSKSTKVYIAEGRVKNKTRRVKIGSHQNELSTEAARREAMRLLSLMETGTDPNALKREARDKDEITLAKAFEDYIEEKDLKPKTVYDYTQTVNLIFATWKRKPLNDITKRMVAKKHKVIGEKRGKGYANLSMRILRAIFKFAKARYDSIEETPTDVLSETRSWYRNVRRQTVISQSALPAFFEGLEKLEGKSSTSKAPVVKDYLLLLLFTGLRRNEAATLRWEDVDLNAKTIRIEDTKNREVHTLPLSTYLYVLLKKRHDEKGNDDIYVFPGSGEKAQHLVEPRRQMEKITKMSGVKFTIHDLRRTFATIAQGLVSAYELKTLLNHKMTGDVTAGYIITDIESLRPGMQKITDAILRLAKKAPEGKVIALRKT